MTERRGTRNANLPVAEARGRRARPVVDDADRMTDLESRLARLEKAPGLRERGRGLMSRVIPDEATRHFRNAGREQLLGVRSIVDFWIERIDASEKGSGKRSRREQIHID